MSGLDDIENAVGCCLDPNDDDTDDDGIIDGNEDLNFDCVVDPGETEPCEIDTDGDNDADGDPDADGERDADGEIDDEGESPPSHAVSNVPSLHAPCTHSHSCVSPSGQSAGSVDSRH